MKIVSVTQNQACLLRSQHPLAAYIITIVEPAAALPLPGSPKYANRAKAGTMQRITTRSHFLLKTSGDWLLLASVIFVSFISGPPNMLGSPGTRHTHRSTPPVRQLLIQSPGSPLLTRRRTSLRYRHTLPVNRVRQERHQTHHHPRRY
jgi:hypothetical protein